MKYILFIWSLEWLALFCISRQRSWNGEAVLLLASSSGTCSVVGMHVVSRVRSTRKRVQVQTSGMAWSQTHNQRPHAMQLRLHNVGASCMTHSHVWSDYLPISVDENYLTWSMGEAESSVILRAWLFFLWPQVNPKVKDFWYDLRSNPDAWHFRQNFILH